MVYEAAPADVQKGLLAAELVIDFLPSPDQLVRKLPKTKITIALNQASIDFFKAYAKKHKVKYQTLINEVLESYVQRYSGENY